MASPFLSHEERAMKKRAVICIILILVAGALSGGLWCAKSQSYQAGQVRSYLKSETANLRLPACKQLPAGGAWYVDGQRSAAKDFSRDCKQVVESEEGQRLYDYANGFAADFPAGAEFDFSRSALQVEVQEGEAVWKISRECALQRDAEAYCRWYFDRFLTDPVHLSENGLTASEEHRTEDGSYWFSVEGEEHYAYAFIATGTRIFYRVALRYPSDMDVTARMEEFLSRFSYFRSRGRACYSRKHEVKIPQEWSRETTEFYRAFCNSKTVSWGIFADKMATDGLDQIIPDLERKLEFHFPLVLYYLPYGDPFPSEFMERAYGQGRHVELTLQLTGYSNEKLAGYTPQLAAYRGWEDNTIRALARGAKAFGHPFFFRLNNEMNSDWTNYSGVTVLEDPDIYVEVWRRFYRIFQEEGVDNVIWVFNPNDRDYPPAHWNHFMNYYPGDDYVQVIGVTGYNTGTYYKKKNNETWREFTQIYDGISARFSPYFSEFPWMITEFASSSVGGDKAAWMERMFRHMGDYKNIKAAVWFHFADFDPEQPEQVARPYWLDETEETLETMRKGLSK